MQQCAGTMKKMALEVGGNAPFIVFDDADIEMAVKGAIASKYRNAGQTCVCANRILVQDGVYDAFTKRLAQTAGAMKVADGFEPGAVIGPLIDMKAVEKVEAHIADALKKGAKVVTGGKRAAQGGSFFEPTVLTDVTTDMVITKEETFGPVAPLYRFKTEAEAVKMANDTEFGLASYFYSRDIGRIWRVAEALEYGIVGINEGIISPKSHWRDRPLRRHEGKRHRPAQPFSSRARFRDRFARSRRRHRATGRSVLWRLHTKSSRQSSALRDARPFPIAHRLRRCGVPRPALPTRFQNRARR